MANINELSIVSYNMHGFFQGITKLSNGAIFSGPTFQGHDNI